MHAMGKEYLADHGRHDMRILQMEIIVGPVKVRGHNGDVIRPVLEVETLAHFQPDNLGKSIGFVGILQFARQQVLLFDRLRTVTRIDAGRTEHQQLLYIVAERFADDILLYLQIFINEIGAVGVVGHNAAHMRRRKNHILGLFVVKKPFYSDTIQQVQLSVRPSDQVGITFRKQIIPDRRPDQAPVSCDIYFCGFFHFKLRVWIEDKVFSRISYRVVP